MKLLMSLIRFSCYMPNSIRQRLMGLVWTICIMRRTNNAVSVIKYKIWFSSECTIICVISSLLIGIPILYDTIPTIDITKDNKQITLITNHKYQSQNCFLGGIRLIKYGRSIPPNPITIIVNLFIISISHITEGRGNNWKYKTL